MQILAFFPHNPMPVRSGAHRRCLEMLLGLRELGHNICLVSSQLVSETPWTEASRQELAKLGIETAIHKPSLLDYAVSGPIAMAHRLLRRPMPVDSRAFCPPGLVRFFQRRLSAARPDLLLINYAHFDRLVNHDEHRELPRWIDMHDLLTLNGQMREALRPYFPAQPKPLADIPCEVLREDFFEKLPPIGMEREYRIYDRYSVTLAISSQECQLVQEHTRQTSVAHLPMTQEVRDLGNTFEGPVLFPAGDNVYNAQAYAYFARRILPQIRSHFPTFVLQVVGPCCARVPGVDNVVLAGFVPDLTAVYRQARFVICPVLGGTGQQVKIVEAMRHGVPVVALQAAARASPIIHGENGLVANNAEEFAEHVCTLWNDRMLCQKLGNNAREMIATHFSNAVLLDHLQRLLHPKN